MSRHATIDIGNVDATRRVARSLADHLPPDATITLDGDLGAGKTTFVKALAEAVGIDPDEVHSPTFGLIHIHDVSPLPAAASGPPRPTRLVHMDAYRLADVGELASIGWEDLEEGPGWLVIEWSERIGGALPKERLTLSLEVTGESTRRLLASATGHAFDRAIDAMLAGSRV